MTDPNTNAILRLNHAARDAADAAESLSVGPSWILEGGRARNPLTLVVAARPNAKACVRPSRALVAR